MSKINLKAKYLAATRKILSAHVPEAEVWAYGSRVTGDAHEASDLDLVVRNPDDLTRPQKKYPSADRSFGRE